MITTHKDNHKVQIVGITANKLWIHKRMEITQHVMTSQLKIHAAPTSWDIDCSVIDFIELHIHSSISVMSFWKILSVRRETISLTPTCHHLTTNRQQSMKLNGYFCHTFFECFHQFEMNKCSCAERFDFRVKAINKEVLQLTCKSISKSSQIWLKTKLVLFPFESNFEYYENIVRFHENSFI